jgi:dipeptidyl aminopeptidase/acylaminoacyl peptidase
MFLPSPQHLLLWIALALCLPCGLLADEPAAPFVPGTPADIPVEYFFRPFAVSGAELNPAGTHVGMRIYDVKRDSHGLVFLDLAHNTIAGTHGDSTYDIFAFSWAGNDRAVFSVARDTHYAWGLYAMPRDDPKGVVTLNEGDLVAVLGTPRARPDNLLVLVKSNLSQAPGVFELDLRKNARSSVRDSSRNIVRKFSTPAGVDAIHHLWRDHDGELRYALGSRRAKLTLYRREADDRWVATPLDPDRDSPMAVDQDPTVMLVAHLNEQGRRELRRYHTQDGSLGPVIYTDEKYDFSAGRVRFSTDGRELIGLTYAQQAPVQLWLRPEETALQQTIDAALPGHINLISSRSEDGRRLLITSFSDCHPGSLYLYEQDTRKFKRLADATPWLPERLMAPTRLVSFNTRDGLKLDGYVTLPLNYKEGRPAPMLVLPHGGPWVRDAWGYDAESQFFASRGYAVFRPNYRGSYGYNAAISLTPRMEFRKMHDDVTDGVHALIAAKIADPAHIAILGASFGGYLALCGAAYEPGLYKCAVCIAGVFDWELFMKEDRDDNNNQFRYEWFRQDLGDPAKNREKFEAMSPIHAVAQIKIPVFVAHGNDDRNADTEQSRRLVKALKDEGVPVEAMFVPEEAHGFAEIQHRIELYTRIEAFLKKNL